MAIREILLSNFRNHEIFKVVADNNFIIISGANGSGKTNILEALSLFSPGKGFKSCSFEEIFRKDSNHREWAAKCTLLLSDDTLNISTGCTIDINGNITRRVIKFNDEISSHHAEILNYLKIIWLTPQTDRIFLEAPAVRRKFLDRLTYNFFPYHALDMLNYEKLVRSRLKIIQDQRYDDLWVNTLEMQLAELNYKIANSRLSCLNYIKEHLANSPSPFLKPTLSLASNINTLISNDEGESVELIKHKLKLNRKLDSISGRTTLGIHRSDLTAHHPDKKIQADSCSTGEQKAMIISIIIAQVKAIKSLSYTPIILLLDEIFSYLDKTFHANLLQELSNLDAQIWVTTTDDQLHEKIQTPYTTIKL